MTKTRVGKIAQLPKEIRDQLNQRLQNGKQGPEILSWLNKLPQTEELLAEKFNHQPITRANLSDWRHGGFQDWLRLQAREERIQRISESGGSLKAREGTGDLFENFARMIVAELAADLESLDEATNPRERWQCLRELSRELVRLQNGYNRSRWAALAWAKRNDRFVESDDAGETQSSELAVQNSEAVVPDRAESYVTPPRFLHHSPCGCVCRKCHTADGPYPYWDAERDAAKRVGSTGRVHRDDGENFYLLNWNCDCTCKRCDSKNGVEADGKPRKSVFRIIHTTKCSCHGTCRKCHAPDSQYPMADVLRDQQLAHEQHSSNIRGDNGISTCVRLSFCQCPCEQCKQNEIE